MEILEQIAQSKKVTKAQIALAWILCRNDEIAAIPGTRKIHRLEENLGTYNVELTVADMAEIRNSMLQTAVGNQYLFC